MGSLFYRCYTLSSISCKVQVSVPSFQNLLVFRRWVSISEIDIMSNVPSNANCEASFLKVTGRIVRQIAFRVFSCSYKLFYRERRVKVKQWPACSRCSCVWPCSSWPWLWDPVVLSWEWEWLSEWSWPWVPCEWSCPWRECSWPWEPCEWSWPWLWEWPWPASASPEQEKLLIKGTFIGVSSTTFICLRFCTPLGLMDLVGYSSESEEPPAKRRQTVYCLWDFFFLLFMQETTTYLPIAITTCTHR